jgi:hypothetical protein
MMKVRTVFIVGKTVTEHIFALGIAKMNNVRFTSRKSGVTVQRRFERAE